MSLSDRVAKLLEQQKSPSTTKLERTKVFCSSPNALAIDAGPRTSLRTPPPSPGGRVLTGFLSFKDIGMSPLPTPRAHVSENRSSEGPLRERESSLPQLRTARSLSNICRANATELDLQAWTPENFLPKFAFNLMAVPKRKRAGQGEKNGKEEGKLAPPPVLERRRNVRRPEEVKGEKLSEKTEQ